MPSKYKKRKINGKHVQAHRQVWEDAYGKIPPGYVIHHRDHDPMNNDLSNLELMSHEAHSRHHNDRHPRIKECVVCFKEFEPAPTKRARAKTCSPECFRALMSQPVGSAKGTAKITEDDVRAIRKAVADGERKTDVAARFGISKPNLSAIIHGRTWKHVV